MTKGQAAMPEREPEHLCVVDDDQFVRRSLAATLEAAGYSVATFPTGPAFLDALESLPDSCVLLDLRMPGMDGLEVLQELQERRPGTPALMISGHGDIAVAVKAMQLGALSFIEKPFEPQQVLDALEYACERCHAYGAQEISENGLRPPLTNLTDRELQVLKLLVEGDQNKVVARRLGISHRTVEVHRSRIMQRLGVDSFAELIRVAVSSGLTID